MVQTMGSYIKSSHGAARLHLTHFLFDDREDICVLIHYFLSNKL